MILFSSGWRRSSAGCPPFFRRLWSTLWWTAGTATQVLSMLQALTLALFMYTGWMTISMLIALQLLLGLINTVDAPRRWLLSTVRALH